MNTYAIIALICVVVVLIAAGIFIGMRRRGNDSRPSGQSQAQAKSQPAQREAEEGGQAAQLGSSGSDERQAEPVQAGSVASKAAEKPESSSSSMTRLKAKLAKSPNPFGKALFSILTKDHLSESDWEDVEDTLLRADVGAEASEQLVDELRADARVRGEKDPQAVRAMLREKLLALVDTGQDRSLAASRPGAAKPSVIIMVGVNGTGKTTTAGKLARLFVAEGKSVVMGAADTFRAAAAAQLQTWASKVGVQVVRAEREGADPASVAFEAAQQAKESGADLLIVDTAGRLQNKANLMDELGKIRRVVEKNLSVDEVLLVLDATTGQNGMVQAKVFAEAIGVTGIVLTKLDGSARGGIVVSVQRELGVPVKLVGLGEGPDDLSSFDPESFVDGILGGE
ncbi:signal recognition particle GTPase [Bifidobacterium actinocoloniiforme DSM 22766]|uniref:Signal recognition particle receptor FtsY n=1 Tax=Bifidobacterium actinocoloniiforme DSM 22766 TaxID=1437605 RepID=A0A086Z2D7_9BIFI|nr:signal recognition particle-docking protein FtsY [Bifidobacterium actinocoloniiforme]AKV55693.1 cell division protein FtsY [Bifidobacterium actinocoloniiforme DSM 22766]KFI40687.1 signal recognition particle GTPase [Bifidobacterium actinocoloniiforme DSM 22766]